MSLLLSNSMLAAALLVGQAADAPPAVKTVTTSSVPAPPTLQPASVQSPSAGQPSAQPQRGPIMSWFSRDDRPVVSKIQTWFKREPAETPPQPMMKREVIRETAPPPLNNTPTPTPTSDFPRRMPSSSSKTPTPTNIIATEPPGAVTDVVLVSGSGTSIKTKTPISSEFATMIGHDEKFEWITGQLEIENGVFVLYYATPDTIDPYHGHIVLLTQQVDMKEFRNGDLVSMRGQLVQAPTSQGSLPIYRLNSASLMERAKQ